MTFEIRSPSLQTTLNEDADAFEVHSTAMNAVQTLEQSTQSSSIVVLKHTAVNIFLVSR